MAVTSLVFFIKSKGFEDQPGDGFVNVIPEELVVVQTVLDSGENFLGITDGVDTFLGDIQAAGITELGFDSKFVEPNTGLFKIHVHCENKYNLPTENVNEIFQLPQFVRSNPRTEPRLPYK